VEKNQYNLCLEVFKRFEQAGILPQVIMIGGWCVIFYEKYFKKSEGLKDFVLRTRDIDFLIANPLKLKGKINVPDLLKDLGFVVSYQGRRGYMKLTHEDLLLEFLVPEKGRGVDGPVALPALGMNAVALRFLNFLTDNTIQVKVEGCVLTLPHPANFALHKLIIAQRRIKEDKAFKDNQAAVSVLKTLVANGQLESIRKVFSEIPSKWQKKIITGLKAIDEAGILNLITSKD
jgi:hypothetical protein